uniref:Immunoglobulin domain-containing protein n=1 Tax=Anabas testudineus TaxID=64144 RepID=A0A3Q1HFD0_ANATE
MALYFGYLFIIFGLKGIYSITTVSKVTVKKGDSITIPCLYDSKYINHVKYLCKGYYWSSCSYAVRTDQPHSSRKFSISDDKMKRIFTVTIKDARDEDTVYYWCAVEINGGSDIGEYFHLSVNRDTPSLYVDHQESTGFNGDNITIYFHDSNSEKIEWCKLRLQGKSCVTGSSGSIDSTQVIIHVKAHSVSTVTMINLTMASSGWYLCVKGNLQMPVHLTVTEKPSTTILSPTTAHSEEKAINTLKHSSTVDIKILVIPLALLIFIVMVTVFTWYKLKKHKQSKLESSPTLKVEDEVIYCDVKHKSQTPEQAGQDVIYCNVGNARETPGQISFDTDVDVMYSSVVTVRQQTVKRVDARDQDVTYSTMTRRQQHI